MVEDLIQDGFLFFLPRTFFGKFIHIFIAFDSCQKARLMPHNHPYLAPSILPLNCIFFLISLLRDKDKQRFSRLILLSFRTYEKKAIFFVHILRIFFPFPLFRNCKSVGRVKNWMKFQYEYDNEQREKWKRMSHDGQWNLFKCDLSFSERNKVKWKYTAAYTKVARDFNCSDLCAR